VSRNWRNWYQNEVDEEIKGEELCTLATTHTRLYTGIRFHEN